MQKPFKAANLVHMMKELVPHVVTPATEPNTPERVELDQNYVT
jgi:hypothetical protein